MKIQIGSLCRFQNRMFGPPHAPHYDAYCGHTFVIDHEHPEDPGGEHVWLKCITNPELTVNGYVHRSDLQLVDAV